MRYLTILICTAIVVLLVTWGISISTFDVQKKASQILWFDHVDYIKPMSNTATPEKCSLSRQCLADHFALRIRSGAANVVGPSICFDGKIIMSHVLNNVEPGLNIVLVNGENGVVEKSEHFNMYSRKPEDTLAFLKGIKPGMIVLVASFEDVTPKMTDDIREIFAEMGSALIKSVKRRDNWVFAGRAGSKNTSLFEKQAVNDEKTNLYNGWPHAVEVEGCFPKT